MKPNISTLLCFGAVLLAYFIRKLDAKRLSFTVLDSRASINFLIVASSVLSHCFITSVYRPIAVSMSSLMASSVDSGRSRHRPM